MEKLFAGFVITFIAVVFTLVIGFYSVLGYGVYQAVKDPAHTAHAIGNIGKEVKDGFNGK
jgi:hypothetical protein